MRILRGLAGQMLPCGCLAGIYETYDSEIVGILDARGPSCAHAAHRTGQPVPFETVGRMSEPPDSSSTHDTSWR